MGRGDGAGDIKADGESGESGGWEDGGRMREWSMASTSERGCAQTKIDSMIIGQQDLLAGR